MATGELLESLLGPLGNELKPYFSSTWLLLRRLIPGCKAPVRFHFFPLASAGDGQLMPESMSTSTKFWSCEPIVQFLLLHQTKNMVKMLKPKGIYR